MGRVDKLFVLWLSVVKRQNVLGQLLGVWQDQRKASIEWRLINHKVKLKEFICVRCGYRRNRENILYEVDKASTKRGMKIGFIGRTGTA
ncbi:hypothetical protein HPP92_028789 [Vanilla planifolia]|uniref:Uncharacterized protein n=1 Tax=Vanilla planifolia TaxID=51239 RepID=A0A835P4U7_VANPL|nr:hypothetical protein HPP92_028789 [Vanilla planifolia]KAG0446554.1 hypothetical protein HPP92_028778 [Vanilla planifolia]